MAASLDGFALLKAIGQNAAAFPDLKAQASKDGRKLIVAQLKKVKTLQALRDVYRAIGKDGFANIADDFSKSAYLKKFDKHWPDLKEASSNALHTRLLSLASESSEPSPPSPRISKASGRKAAAPKIKKTSVKKKLQTQAERDRELIERNNSPAMGAKWEKK